jgi:hypothetical protein
MSLHILSHTGDPLTLLLLEQAQVETPKVGPSGLLQEGST